MTLGTLRAACQRRTGSALSTEFYTDAINEALHALVDVHDWPWLEASWTFPTVIGTAVYALPFDAVRVRSVSLGGYELRHTVPLDVDDARVEGWAVAGDQLLLGPTPVQSSTVIVRYIRQESDLVNDADTPDLPDHYAGAVVAYVSSIVYEREGDLKKLTVAEARFAQWKRRMLAETRRYSGPTRIRVTSNRGL